MQDLIDAMTNITEAVGVHRACMRVMSLPPSDKILAHAARTHTKVAKSFGSAVTVAEKRLRVRERDYKQSGDITPARAVQAIRGFDTHGQNPYAGTNLMDRLLTQRAEIEGAQRQAMRLFGRNLDYNSRWVFTVTRLVYAAQRYRQVDKCKNIVQLMTINAIDDRAAYYFAGQLLGGHVTQADRFFLVNLDHVTKAHNSVLAASLAYNDYQEALEVFRFAKPIYQNNPEALKVLCEYLDEVHRWLADGLSDFRTVCVHAPGLSELVAKHFSNQLCS